MFVEIHENVRGEDVFVIQSTSYPANDNLMELLICIDALRRASARRITAVRALLRLCPAGPQAGSAHADLGQAGRQPDHRGGGRPGAAVDLHAGQIQGFFDIPTDNLYAAPVMAADILRVTAGRS